MSRERLADAYEEQAALFARLADTTAQIAHELRGIDSSAPVRADEPVARTGLAGTEGVVPPMPSSVPVQEQYVESRLGYCPVHKVAWTVRPAGVSKAGKRYSAFWKCSERDANGFCDQKPVAAWADAHPPSVAA